VIDDHLAAGRSVCPFAKGARKLYVRDSASRSQMLAGVREFAKARGAALIVCAPEGSNDWSFERTRTWVRDTFLELMICFGLSEDVEMERFVREFVRPLLYNDADPRRPMLGHAGMPLFAICLAPVYPEKHPRYAPQASVVVTRQSDVAEAATSSPAVVAQIRAAMKDTHGFVYDADELMLPLPKVST
jgi:hypothetical protein